MDNNIRRSVSSESAIIGIAADIGEPVSSAMNQPIHLSDPASVWFVEAGVLDVSAAEYSDAEIQSPFKHFLQLEAGDLAFGVAERASSGLKLVAKGLPGTRLRRISIAALLERAVREGCVAELAALVDAWIVGFAAAVAKDISPQPRPDARLNPGRESKPSIAGILAAERGTDVVWLSGADLQAAFLQLEEASDDGPGLMPATPDAWVALRSVEKVVCTASSGLEIEVLLRRALPEFHRLALGAEALNRKLGLVDDANLQVAQVSQRRRDEQTARRGLANLYDARHIDQTADESALAAALMKIGRHEGFAIVAPAPLTNRKANLRDYLMASGLRARKVRLAKEDRWWLGDSGALLAFRLDGGQPVALLPGRGRSYRLIDPVSGRTRRTSRATTDELLDEAWSFYRTLPDDEPVRMRDLFKVAGWGSIFDLARLVVTGIGAGLLLLTPAVAVNHLVGSVIPNGSTAALLQLTALLAGIAIVAALAHTLRGTALMRLEGRVASRLASAVWDRLLRLKPAFFRRFTTGDLTARAMTFQSLRDQISGIAADAALSVVFLLPMFSLVFYYDRALGWLTLGLGLATMALTSVLAALLIDPQRRHLTHERRLAGDLIQFIGGIAKLRMLGAEASAFAMWAKRFRKQKRNEIRISVLSEHIAAFSAAIPALGGAAVFALALQREPGQLQAADFVAVYTASMVFYMAVATLGQSLQTVASIMPTCEQALPILEAETDSRPHGGASVRLDGEISLHKVSFRYAENGPKVLDDVSLHIGADEFIGIVGESGCGKTTLFRLIIGLEEPLTGAVYYDGKDLNKLDLESVRQQMGILMQNVSLRDGNVLNNIIGADLDLTEEDAWSAARMAAIDRDIAAMPMRMHTAVGEEGMTFSGGQGQRIRIAAALSRRPRIIFLDEPTSWLDNRSQAETMRGIGELVGTRIVIAHRLSTIRDADRIYVMQAGRVAQQGTFDELIDIDGPFRDLAARQML